MANVVDKSGNTVKDKGIVFDVDNLPQTLAYDGSNNLTSITITNGNTTWVKTFTYTSGLLTAISKWVRQ